MAANLWMKHGKFSLFAVLVSLLLFFIFGVVTSVLPNPYFRRMTPASGLDYLFLAITSILLGAFLGISILKDSKKSCMASASSGGFAGILSFACPVCNKLLVLLLGVAGIMAFIEPYRPLFGVVGISLLSYAVYKKGKSVAW
ncbi:MAG TPA: hypothetical protein VJI46_06060 [Candidatus Nanoarchaeia archaeon]|nr:hypothetical protein [Candidatus Nanoarchaeia archaeon]